eukprot:GHVU01105308.1.p1 GENE.GHVU01105308.1~~GHVU01105308.1.p1  ORF type:complete len:627 (-),score=114.60 GHVU01105308.1:153-2033(-)
MKYPLQSKSLLSSSDSPDPVGPTAVLPDRITRLGLTAPGATQGSLRARKSGEEPNSLFYYTFNTMRQKRKINRSGREGNQRERMEAEEVVDFDGGDSADGNAAVAELEGNGEEDEEMGEKVDDINFIKNDDPEFFAFLKANDPALLHQAAALRQGQSSDDDEASSHGEEDGDGKEEKRRRKKRKRLEEGSGDAQHRAEDEEGEAVGGGDDSCLLSRERFRAIWGLAMKEKSLRGLRLLAECYRSAARCYCGGKASPASMGCEEGASKGGGKEGKLPGREGQKGKGGASGPQQKRSNESSRTTSQGASRARGMFQLDDPSLAGEVMLRIANVMGLLLSLHAGPVDRDTVPAGVYARSRGPSGGGAKERGAEEGQLRSSQVKALNAGIESWVDGAYSQEAEVSAEAYGPPVPLAHFKHWHKVQRPAKVFWGETAFLLDSLPSSSDDLPALLVRCAHPALLTWFFSLAPLHSPVSRAVARVFASASQRLARAASLNFLRALCLAPPDALRLRFSMTQMATPDRLRDALPAAPPANDDIARKVDAHRQRIASRSISAVANAIGNRYSWRHYNAHVHSANGVMELLATDCKMAYRLAYSGIRALGLAVRAAASATSTPANQSKSKSAQHRR